MSRNAPRPDDPTDRDELEKLFLDHLDLVERAGASAARRYGLDPQDVEDFVSTVKLKLIDDDYAVLRQHRGDSSLSTFLVAVVHHKLKDFCDHKFGKFRPSAKAKELGPAAVALERLLWVEKRDLEGAIEVLARRDDLDVSRDELRRIHDQLPVRERRSFVGDEALAQHAVSSPESAPERRLEDDERQATATRVEEVLNLALKALTVQDLLILKLHFRDGLTIAQVATTLHLEQRPLYRRKAKCLETLHAAFEAEGLTWEEVRTILGWGEREIRPDFKAGDENPGDGSDSSREAD